MASIKHISLETVAILSLNQGRFFEAVELWCRAELSRNRCTIKECSGEFLPLKCAGCFEARLRFLSLDKFDHDYQALANRLKQWSASAVREAEGVAGMAENPGMLAENMPH